MPRRLLLDDHELVVAWVPEKEEQGDRAVTADQLANVHLRCLERGVIRARVR